MNYTENYDLYTLSGLVICELYLNTVATKIGSWISPKYPSVEKCVNNMAHTLNVILCSHLDIGLYL